jgi:hypothetical protein
MRPRGRWGIETHSLLRFLRRSLIPAPLMSCDPDGSELEAVRARRTQMEKHRNTSPGYADHSPTSARADHVLTSIFTLFLGIIP